MSTPLQVAIFGSNGHQIHKLLVNHPHARLTAYAAIDPLQLEKVGHDLKAIHRADSLESLLQWPEVDLVSLCSPKRSEQAQQAIICLQAGKHVYAEKPCALNERDLEGILHTAQASGCAFHEMAGTVFENASYLGLCKVVLGGAIGTVVQVNAEKSYPWHEKRPTDEQTDGGLIRWVAVHAFRMVEHVTGVRIREVKAVETHAGHPRTAQGDTSPIAAVMVLTLENGAVASVTANYLNPRGTGVWGYESVRVFGTLGMVESTHQGTKTNLYIGNKDCGPVDVSEPGRDYFNFVVDALRGHAAMPLSLEDELHPTRMVLRAKLSVG